MVKAIVLSDYGPPEVLVPGQVEIGPPDAGAAGSVGLIACQLAAARGAHVLAAVRPEDFDVVAQVGAVPVAFGSDLVAEVKAHAPAVDAVIDASGAGVLGAAVELAGGPARVVTLSDPAAPGFGVRLSGPDGPHVAQRLQTVMDLLAAGRLTLRAQTVIPLADAAGAHRALESHQLRAKVLLSVPA